MCTGLVSIDILPEDALLHIFLFDRVTFSDGLDVVNRLHRSWRWHRLVQVCRRWRSVVFASPNFLDLKLVCDLRTRLELAGIWPPFPIVIRNIVGWPMPEDYDFEAIIMHRNRVCDINLFLLSRSQLQQLASAMQEQFPVLINLRPSPGHYNGPPLALLNGSEIP